MSSSLRRVQSCDERDIEGWNGKEMDWEEWSHVGGLDWLDWVQCVWCGDVWCGFEWNEVE